MIAIMSQVIEDLGAALPANACSSFRVDKGSLLFREGERPAHLFAIRSGRVDLMRWTASGTEIRLHSAGAGETLAEASLFADAYHCDAVVRANATITRFDLQAVRRACEASTTLSIALLRHVSSSLRDTRRVIELRSITPLTERLHAKLSEVADADGHLPANLRMKDTAREIGATPEATYRAAASLTDAGRLERLGRGRFRLLPSRGR